MKRTILNLMNKAGAFAAFRIANRGKVLILTYHRFSRRANPWRVSAPQFEAHLDYLTRHHRLLPLSAVAASLRNGETLPSGTAVITIDDGYSDAYEIAFPILRRYGVPATFFIVTDFLDRKTWLWTDKLRFLTAQAEANKLTALIGNQKIEAYLNGHESRFAVAALVNSSLKGLPVREREEVIGSIAARLGIRVPESPPAEYAPITWGQALEMEAAGIELGSHSKTHPILTTLDDSGLCDELVESRLRLEDALQHEIDIFCYPNGDVDERVRRSASAAGYRCAVTVEPGFNSASSDALRLRRMDAEADFVRFLQITSGFDQLKKRFKNFHANPVNAYSCR